MPGWSHARGLRVHFQVASAWRMAALFLLLPVTSIFAQSGETALSTRIQVLLPRDGLGGEAVRSIAETPDGALWFACWAVGVSRFDGYHWHTFTDQDGLPTKDVRHLLVDNTGRLWCGTTEGLAVFEKGKWRRVDTGLPGADRPNVWCGALAQDGSLWFATAGGSKVVRFAPAPDSGLSGAGQPVGDWSMPGDFSALGDNVILALLSASPDEMWAKIRGQGILVYRNGTWEQRWNAPEDGSMEIPLVQSGDGTVWSVDGGQLIRYAGKERTAISLGNRSASGLGVGKSGEIYIGSMDGICVYSGGSVRDINTGYLSNFSPPRIMLLARNGVLWAGTAFGAYRLATPSWALANPDVPGAASLGLRIYTSPEQSPVAADLLGNLYEWDGNQWQAAFSVGNGKELCVGMPAVRKGIGWAVFQDHAVEFSLPGKQKLRDLSLPVVEGALPVLLPAPSGRLLLGLRNKILEFKDGQWVLSNAIEGQRLVTMQEDSAGCVWAVLSDFVVHETPGGWQTLCIPGADTPLDSVESLSLTPAGSVLLGCVSRGLLEVKDGTLSPVASFDMAFGRHPNTVLQTAEGLYWIGNRQAGISSYQDGLWRVFSQEQGVSAGRVTFLGAGPEGDLWASVEGAGLLRYQPDLEGPETVIDRCPTVVPAGEEWIVKFSGIDKWGVTKREDLCFSWRVLDTAGQAIVPWSPFLRQDYAIAPRLGAGQYTIEVRAIDLDRNIDPHPAVQPFGVELPVWRTPAFYLPIGALVSICVGLAFLYFRKHVLLEERKRSEAALQKERDQAQMYLDIAGVMMAAIDTEGRVRLMNGKGCEILGYTEGELIGKNWFDLCLPEEVREDVRSRHRQMRNRSAASRYYEHPVQTRGGAQRLIAFHCVLIRDADATVTGEFFSGVDITERERAEAERRALEERLAQSQKMESIGRLAGGVAHDFNNMLTVILGYGEMMTEDIPSDSPLRKPLGDIMEAGRRARNLTRQLLAFSRRQVLEVRTLNLNEVVRGMENMLRRLLGEDVGLYFEIPPAPQYVRADVSQLEQVLMNLCVNARDAMPKGGRLSIRVSSEQVEERYASGPEGLRSGFYVTLSVADTGCGMDAETRQRIFEPFFTTKEKGRGTGLGLSTAYGIVKQHGGDVSVYSEPGKGTTFKIYLPEAEESEMGIPDEGRPEVPRGRGETILVIEDDGAVAAMVCSMVRLLGYTAVRAKDVRECLDYVASAQPLDLLLTDIVMPDMNGRELFERASVLRPGLKALYMSGYTEEIIGHHGILEEGVHFIAKPFGEQALGLKIRQALEAS